MTLAELAVTIAMLGVLGLIANRVGLSAIPAYLLAGMILGPNQPKVFTLVSPSEVTQFVAEIGIIFLLFFLGLEFTFTRISRSSRHVLLGGLLDFVANAGLGLLVGVAVFGFSFAALILAAAIYVSSSAITVKALIDFRRLADDETDLVLAILVAEDIAIALALGYAAGGGGDAAATLAILAKAVGFIAICVILSFRASGLVDRILDWLPREIFLLAVFGFLVGLAAAAEELGLSAAIGALLAGIVLSETEMREEIEERFFSFRDVFAALFFFVFGLSIDVAAVGDVGWILALAVPATVLGKIGAGHLAGRVGGLTPRQSFNAGVALIAHGEFTIIIAELASQNDQLLPSDQETIVAFAGLYVLITASIGVVLMKESKVLGRRLFPAPRLAE
ncbi:MAG TPA: cation:proton antiporter [Gaiellaceae bacterium]|nr:cation:proton antiporter [Gaiellaceae bacterium]HEX2495452.1 cation:proton antiporter [Gaiellaceae bacterium]